MITLTILVIQIPYSLHTIVKSSYKFDKSPLGNPLTNISKKLNKLNKLNHRNSVISVH